MEASAALPLHVARGEIPGYKVNYGAPLGRPSERTIYRKRKLEMQASEIREKRDAAFRHNQGQKTLLTHFFSSTSHAQETSRDVEAQGAEQPDTSTAASGRESPTQSALGPVLVESDLESASNSIAGDSEIDEVIERFPDADAERLSDVRSTPVRFCRPPTSEQASGAATALLEVMQTRRGSGRSWKYTKFDLVTYTRLNDMLSLFRLYTQDPMFQDQWKRASITVAKSKGKSNWYSRKLRQWCRDFIDDPRSLPRRKYGRSTSVIHSDEDLRLEIITHLQSIGRYFSANDLLNYVNQPAILERLHVERRLTLRTAQNWLKLFSFRWRAEARGMYTDGHEREDVVKYRQEVFLPKYLDLNLRAAQYDDDGNELPRDSPQSGGKQVVFHHHDETVYYGNDRRSLR